MRKKTVYLMKKGVYAFFICSVVVLFLIVPAADAYLGLSRYLGNRYTYDGQIRLQYERRESSGSVKDYEDFTHFYTLGVNGYLLDPRLATFRVSGRYFQKIRDPGVTSDTYGISSWLRLLNQRPRRGFLSYLPNPIMLRYAYYNSDDKVKTTNYGISLLYKRDKRIGFFQRGKAISLIDRKRELLNKLNNYNYINNNNLNGNGEKNGFSVPVPTFYLDYDKSEIESGGTSVDYHHLSARAEMMESAYRSRLEYYLYQNSDGDESREDRFNFDLDLFLIGDTDTRLDMYNRVRYSDRDSLQRLKTWNVSHSTVWNQRVGDNIGDSIYGSVSPYYRSSDPGYDNYGVSASSTYSKVISPRAVNNVTIWGGYDVVDDDSDDDSQGGVTNQLVLRLSRVFSASQTTAVSENRNGVNYGMGLSLNVRKRFSTTVGYHFESSAREDGRSTRHAYLLNVSGRIMRRLTMSTHGRYDVASTSGILPTESRALFLSADFFTNINRYRISFGGTRTDQRSESTVVNEKKITTLRSNMQTYFTRNLISGVGVYYSWDDNDNATFTFSPYMSWSFRKIVIDAEYKFEESRTPTRNVNEQRFFVRLTRYFSGGFRGL